MLNAVGTPMLGASKKCHGLVLGIRLAFEVFEIIGKASVLLDGIVMKRIDKTRGDFSFSRARRDSNPRHRGS